MPKKKQLSPPTNLESLEVIKENLEQVRTLEEVKTPKATYKLTEWNKVQAGDLVEYQTYVTRDGLPGERFVVGACFKDLPKGTHYETAIGQYTYLANTKDKQEGEGSENIVFIYSKVYEEKQSVQKTGSSKSITRTSNLRDKPEDKKI